MLGLVKMSDDVVTPQNLDMLGPIEMSDNVNACRKRAKKREKFGGKTSFVSYELLRLFRLVAI